MMPIKNVFKQPSAVLCCVLGFAGSLRASNLDCVNPFIGSAGNSKTEYGGMMPFVVKPFGMTS